MTNDAADDPKQGGPAFDPRAKATLPAIKDPAAALQTLPFRAGSAPALDLRRGIGAALPRRPAPKQLNGPGTLIPLAAFVAAMPRPSAGAAADPSSARTAAPEPAVRSGSASDGSPASPWTHASQPGLVGAGAPTPPGYLGGGAPTPPGYPPSGAAPPPASPGLSSSSADFGASPWLSSQAIAPELLPSAAVELPSARPEPAPAPVVPREPSGSRGAMTVVLAIAALALIGAIAYLAVLGRKKSDGPADIKAGQQQQDYSMATAAPTAAATATPHATATAAPAAHPVYLPAPKLAPAPKKPGGDAYDDL